MSFLLTLRDFFIVRNIFGNVTDGAKLWTVNKEILVFNKERNKS